MIAIAILASFLSGWAFLRFTSRSSLTENLALSLPVGMVLNFLLFWCAWLVGFNWDAYLRMQGVVTLLALIFSLESLKKGVQNILSQSKLQKLSGLFSASVSFPNWPLLWMGLIAVFSFGLITAWSLSVQTVHWDSLSLYHQRGELLAENSSLQDFLEVRQQHEDLLFYDRLHPWLASYTAASSVWAHWPFTQIWQWLLCGSVLLFSWIRWKSVKKILILCFFLFTIQSSFTSFIEGYGGILSGLFWLLFWLELSKKDPSPLTTSLLLAGSMSARLAEPYWIIALLIGVWHWRYRWQNAIQFAFFPAITYLSWQYFVQVWDHTPAAALESVLPGTKLVVPEWQIDIFVRTLSQWITSEAAILLGFTVLSVFILRPVWTTWRRQLYFFLLTGHGLLFTGMMYLAMSSPTAWSDIQTAIPRAAYPLTVVSILLIADSESRRKHESR